METATDVPVDARIDLVEGLVAPADDDAEALPEGEADAGTDDGQAGGDTGCGCSFAR